MTEFSLVESIFALSFDQTWLVLAVGTPNHGLRAMLWSRVRDRPNNFFFF